MVMQAMMELFAAIVLSVIAAALAQFGVSVRSHAVVHPAVVQQVVMRVPVHPHAALCTRRRHYA